MNNLLLQKINSGVAAVLAIVGTILVILVFTSWDADASMADYEKSTNYISMAITYTGWIAGIAFVLFAFGLMLFGLLIRPARMIPLYAGAAVLAIIFGIGWAMSNGAIPAGVAGEGLTESVSHWSGAGLYTVCVLSVLAVGSIVFSLVSKFFR